jgi:acyl-CoA dehydrogenase
MTSYLDIAAEGDIDAAYAGLRDSSPVAVAEALAKRGAVPQAMELGERMHGGQSAEVRTVVQIAGCEYVVQAVAGFARQRRMFGDRLAGLQAFRHRFADGLAAVSVARALAGTGEPAARLVAAHACRVVVNGCGQALGSTGTLDDTLWQLRRLSPDSAETASLTDALASRPNIHGLTEIESVAAEAGIGAAAALVAHSDIACGYLRDLGTARQRERWLADGLVGAFALTEPDGGSDMSVIRCEATRQDGGWRIDGVKSVVTNGLHADFAVVVCRVDGELTLFVVDLVSSGVQRKPCSAVGWRTANLAELRFDGCTGATLLGEIGGARTAMRATLPRERVAAASQVAAALDCLAGQWTAEPRMEIAWLRCVSLAGRAAARWASQSTGPAGELAAMLAKLWTTEEAFAAVDRLVGHEPPHLRDLLARTWADTRASRLAGGSSELLRDLIASTLS